MSVKVLIVDDEPNICELIKIYVEKEGFDAFVAYDGEISVKLIKKLKPSIVLLDVMLPKKDGFQVLREVRAFSDVPIIMLTAKGETLDKVLGFELGADDYVVKPFEPKELIARIKAVLRRTKPNFEQLTKEKIIANKEKELVFKGLRINQETYEVFLDEQKIEMPPKEFELLSFLCSNANKVFTRDQLLDEIWGYEFFGYSRTIDVHIKRIREKIEGNGNHKNDWTLKTIWGIGYKFEVAV